MSNAAERSSKLRALWSFETLMSYINEAMGAKSSLHWVEQKIGGKAMETMRIDNFSVMGEKTNPECVGTDSGLV